jgi:hypothetical protein
LSLGALLMSTKNKWLFAISGLVCLFLYNNCSEPFEAAETGLDSFSSESTSEAVPANPNDDNTPTDTVVEVPVSDIEEPSPGPMPPLPDNNGDMMTTPPPNPSTMGPALVAVGQQESMMYSCDGGKSWQGYQQATAQRCYDASQGNFDCDHSPGASVGLAYGRDGFMASFGWGSAGRVLKSVDGINWVPVTKDTIFAGVAYGNGHYYLNSRRNGLVSNDGGETWMEAGDVLTNPFNQRRTFFIPGGGGRFVSLANSSGDNDLFISKDNAQSFARPTTLPRDCGNGDWAIGNGMAMVHSGVLCYTLDNGDTWLIGQKPPTSALMFNGTEFRSYGRGEFYSSRDGMNWQRSPVTLDGQANSRVYLNQVTYQPQLGTYAATNQRWKNWYESTEFYWSNNGVDWFTVPANQAPAAPHQVRSIVAGFLPTCQ